MAQCNQYSPFRRLRITCAEQSKSMCSSKLLGYLMILFYIIVMLLLWLS